MTPEQVALVQESFAKVAPIAPQAAALFYGNLFAADPSLKALFKGDMDEQGKKLMQVLATAVNSLKNLPGLVPVLQALAKRHVGYGVKDEHYATVGGALLLTLSQGLGDAFTDDVKEAWVTTYTLIADTMKAAANS